MRLWIGLALLLLAFGLVSMWHERAEHWPPGVLVADAPQQHPLSDARAFAHGKVMLMPRAQFELSARVLAREDYHFDRLARLVPTDLALGWGPMSDSAVLKQINISQSHRFYHWRVAHFPISRRAIETHSANMHLIPASEDVAKELADVRVGQVVHIEGELVDARIDGGLLRTSLSRNDTGAGACEVIYVRALRIER
ncbi:hypothetical protein [Oleiagrimonas sp. C23AA]|uniref:hypothetical protein n=1 Tax=Oleiagrimonas sp. C23AA TaxID=2719047 RepID=UPI0014223B7F|nr:hypothetical protein [Oleiagrimonas sp. C23AA]NII09990.1 hypothetical protein [Oleiagrimonas sp. C23AA]